MPSPQRYLFFFSYASKNRDAYLLQFFADLQRYVDQYVPLENGMEVAFMDQRELETGTDWDPALLNALQNSQLLVCAYSPHYFMSEMCSREWQFFRLRRQLYASQNGEPDAPKPAAIKPVIWFPFEQVSFPDITRQEIYSIQFRGGKKPPAENNISVEHMLRKRARYEIEYQELIETLGQEIGTAASQGPHWPQAPDSMKTLTDIAPLFPMPCWEKDDADTQAAPVVFGLLRGESADAGSALAQPWRPFGLATEPIVYTLYGIAAADLNMVCSVAALKSVEQARHRVHSASQRAQAIVLIVDAALCDSVSPEDLASSNCLIIWIGETAKPLPHPDMLHVATLRDLRALLNAQLPRLRSQVRSRSDVCLSASFAMAKPSISAAAAPGVARAV